MQKNRVEVLSPVGSAESLEAAVRAGADAVYMGAKQFSARRNAENFDNGSLKTAVEYCHVRGVKVYLTLNIMVKQNELSAALDTARAAYLAGVDALIVQDMAYWKMNLPIALHASTQTNCATAERVRFFEEMGFARAILERSLSKNDIAEIRKATNIELEAFVHGAICVSQSGRCFFSRSTSERSGNRGECSQPCRLEYDLCNDQGEVMTYQQGPRAGQPIPDRQLVLQIKTEKGQVLVVRTNSPRLVPLFTGDLDREADGKNQFGDDVFIVEAPEGKLRFVTFKYPYKNGQKGDVADLEEVD